MSRVVTSQWLGYLGLIPFLGFCAGFYWLEDWPRSVSVQGFVIYSLAIFCFLAGALWGQAQQSDEALSVPTLLISNGLVLFAVTALLTAQTMLASVLLALGYLALLWFELRTSSQERWYLVMRKRLTLGVFAAHLIYVSLHISGA